MFKLWAGLHAQIIGLQQVRLSNRDFPARNVSPPFLSLGLTCFLSWVANTQLNQLGPKRLIRTVARLPIMADPLGKYNLHCL